MSDQPQKGQRSKILATMGTTPLEIQVTVATQSREKSRGLLGRKVMAPDEALLLPDTRWIHTMGMTFSLDLVYLDRQGKIVSLQPHLPPWRIGWLVWRAAHTLELQAGTIERAGLVLNTMCFCHPSLTQLLALS
ncbi:MAG: DUF192 domain-containing protein [Chloroflexi bacterium]|nr:DUF192 domain-containing protein [Chloroflexota bacterium]